MEAALRFVFGAAALSGPFASLEAPLASAPAAAAALAGPSVSAMTSSADQDPEARQRSERSGGFVSSGTAAIVIRDPILQTYFLP